MCISSLGQGAVFKCPDSLAHSHSFFWGGQLIDSVPARTNGNGHGTKLALPMCEGLVLEPSWVDDVSHHDFLGTATVGFHDNIVIT